MTHDAGVKTQTQYDSTLFSFYGKRNAIDKLSLKLLLTHSHI